MDTLNVVRRTVGRRYRIGRDEMARVLFDLHAAGLDLGNGYIIMPDDAEPWETWARACKGITCVSVDARGSLRDGYVRYDEPGRMHPLQRAEITFAPLGLYPESADFLRRHARRVLWIA